MGAQMRAGGFQLDLFVDSRTVVCANEAIDALLAGDAERAAIGIERLQSEEPDHPSVHPLRCLLRELLESPLPAAAASEVAAAVERLEREVEPAARNALGMRAADFMRLALVAPARLTHTLDRIGDAKLARDFAAFEAQCDWLASEDETAAGWFPAWYLIEYPGAELGLERGSVPDTASARAAGQLTRLQALERRGYSPELVSARRDLQALAPRLFALYMARRQVAHR